MGAAIGRASATTMMASYSTVYAMFEPLLAEARAEFPAVEAAHDGLEIEVALPP